MSVVRRRQNRCIACDHCGEESEEYNDDNFRQMIDDLKEEGWLITMINGRSWHLCTDCAEDDEVDSLPGDVLS